MEKLACFGARNRRFCLLHSNTHTRPVPSPWNTYDFLAGWGCVDEVKVNSNGLQALGAFLEKHRNRWIFGFISYDLKNEIERLESGNPDRLNLPLLHFFVPENVLTGSDGKIQAWSHDHAYEGEDIIAAIERTARSGTAHEDPVKLKSDLDRGQYMETVSPVKAHIRRGDIYEMNLCRSHYADGADIDPVRTWLRLNDLSPGPMSAYYRLGGHHVISSSPERFLKKTGSRLVSQPIKGTARREKEPKDDRRIARLLQESEKERAENVMIVDLVRNDLSRIAARGSVAVEELFGIYTFATLHHMISTVRCDIRAGAGMTDILKSAFPMGSMTGAPKISAMQLIEKFERSRRGLFSGTLGYIDPDGNFDFNVIIRTIFYNEDLKTVSLTTGSAITAGSEAASEYGECLLKASALASALHASVE